MDRAGRAGIERELARVLRWFGHVERMDEYRMARRVLMAEVSLGWVPERSRLGWMYGVKEALDNKNDWRLRHHACKLRKSGEPWYICN